MTNRFLTSVAAIALIAAAGAANAQGTAGHESGGTATESAPSSPGGGTNMQKHESTEPSSSKKSTQSEQKPPAATKNQHAEDNMGQKAKSSESPTKGDNNMKAETRDGQNGNMKAETRDNKANAENKNGTENRSETTGQAASGAKLSTEQRTKITTVIRDQHIAPVTNVNFSIAVGTRVPREGMSFHPLPVEVVTIYPQWRGYEFILVGDRILVVDPASFEIVAVLEA